MSEIEEEALALVNEARAERGYSDVQTYPADRKFPPFEALCRAIEKHEADKAAHAATIEGILKAHEAFRQEVSDAVELANMRVKELKRNTSYIVNHMQQYIIPKPDPLVAAMAECGVDPFESWADQLREALAKRGLKIVEIER